MTTPDTPFLCLEYFLKKVKTHNQEQEVCTISAFSQPAMTQVIWKWLSYVHLNCPKYVLTTVSFSQSPKHLLHALQIATMMRQL